MKRKVKKEEKKVYRLFLTKEVIIVLSLLILAFILRLIYLSHLKANDPNFYNLPEGTDMLTYHNFAKQIINGTLEKEPYYYGPLYFYFLALIYKLFGIEPYIPRLIQMILGVLTTFLTYLIAKRVFNKTIGYISLVISILYPMFYIHEGVLLMEPLVTFLNTLSIFLLLKVENSPSYKNIALAGISLGLSALARANILFFIPFILFWFLKSEIRNPKSEILKKYAFLCLIIGLTISPATIRNYLVSGKFVLISTNGPVNLWIGNNPYATGEYKYPSSPYNEIIGERVRKEGDGVYIKEVISFVKEEPKDFLRLLFKKFLLFWSNLEIDNNFNFLLQKNYSSILSLPLFIDFGSIGPLALTGILLSLTFFKRTLLLYIFSFSGMSAIVIMFVLGRYRACFIPILIVFAGFALYWFYEKAKARNLKLLFLSLIPLVFSILLVFSQSIAGYLHPLLHPESMVIKIQDRVIIRDDSGSWPGKDSITLNPGDRIKKEFMFKEDLSKYKETRLFFSYQGLTGGSLAFDINGKIKGTAMLGSTDLMNTGSIQLLGSLFSKGLNTITVEAQDIKIAIPIDSSYTFGRSYILKNGQWEKLKRGEFMIWLELVE